MHQEGMTKTNSGIRVGLVLEGGGMKGLYTAGVLDTMMDKGFLPDVICGTSAGVTFGVNLPSGQKGRVLRYNTTYAKDPAYISMRSLLLSGDIVNYEFAYHRLPESLDPIDNEAFVAAGVEFYATVTNVLTGEAEYLPVRDCKQDIEIIRASASLPFVSRKVMIDGTPYLDGGIVDNIPISKCLERGCDKIIVVLTHARDYVRNENLARLARILYRKDKNLIKAFERRDERYNKSKQLIADLERQGRVFVIAPEQELNIGRLESDPGKMTAVHALGATDANRLWSQIESYLR